jgi:hypothetical protein
VHSEELTSLTIIEQGFIAVVRGRVSSQIIFLLLRIKYHHVEDD